MNPIIAVFGASRTTRSDPEWGQAVELGRLLVEAGAEVATGGYAGLMEAVSEGAHLAGGRPIGVTAPTVFPGRSGANGFVDREIEAPSLPTRIARIVDISDASVALPGSLGTFAELIVAWNTAFVAPFRQAEPKPVVAIGEAWSHMIGMLETTIGADAGFVTCVPDVDAVIGALEGRVAGIASPIG